MPISCVYILFNTEGFYYIGQTTHLSNRLKSHRYDCKNNNPCSSKTLGADWDHEILEECPSNELHTAERFYYDFYQELDPEHMVNKFMPMRTQRQYQRDNFEQTRESSHRYYVKNLEKRREYYREQAARNRAKRKGVAI